ncbi:hypothetical protein J5N97_026038 [Dioscorea zingiberensis]|uniref:Uncharacterized protein n=1 Tax=Dioscorea zingiberensis TaxID=325984 RepID=A0A9D5C223_9LILI|nr:hypothetical protein J5N97_026038 [Dioscorea zingiberensis]
MHPRYATASQERQRLDEVLHLHSLWRRGPPRNPSPPSRAPPAVALSVNRENRIRKKQEKRRKRKQERKKKLQQQVSSSVHPPAAEDRWPCSPSPPSKPEPSNWPDPVLKKMPMLVSADEEARAAALQVQNSGVRASREFFRKSSSSDDDADEEDEMEDDEDGEDDAESRAFRFFLGLFEKNEELRRYYERNFEKGEFCCLVCGAMGKIGKRFPNCVGLVQHSKSISKTKRREAHRGFAKAVCRVMGWDMERLPSIVLDLKDSLGQLLAKADKSQEEGMHVEASSDVNKQVTKEAAVNVETDKEDLVGSSLIRIIESLPEGEGMHKEASSGMKEEVTEEVVNVEMNKEYPVSSSPIRDMEALPEDGMHEGSSNIREDVAKEVVNVEGNKLDSMRSSPTENMEALPEEKIQEEGSSDMREETIKEVFNVETNKEDPLNSSEEEIADEQGKV